MRHLPTFASLVVIGSGVWSASAIQQGGRAAPGDDPGMMSNEMIAGFDPAAGMRAAQATRDPARRTEILAQPGETHLQAVVGNRLAEAVLTVARLPDGLDPETWPAISLIGSSSAKYVVTNIELRVAGCAIQMPPRQNGFADPNAAELRFQGGRWRLGLHGSGDAEAYGVTYTFDNARVVDQLIDYGGPYRARWAIDEDDYGSPRDCRPAGGRRFGARAEPKAAPVK